MIVVGIIAATNDGPLCEIMEQEDHSYLPEALNRWMLRMDVSPEDCTVKEYESFAEAQEDISRIMRENN